MNFQNIPREDKTIKRAFMPKLDAFLFCDYEAVEVRLLAFYLHSIGDHSLVKEFAKGLDPHVETTKKVLGITEAEWDKLSPESKSSKRQIGKRLNFSVIYGGGPKTISKQLRIDYLPARSLQRKFHAERPGIKELQDRLHKAHVARGYLKTLWGRRLDPDSEHKELNALIQGCAADLIRDAIVKTHWWLSEYDLRSHLVSVIHDELIADCAYGDLAWIAESVPLLMGNERIESVIPLNVEVEWSSTNWADKKPWADKEAA